jgi:type II secretory pathway pseudopilin PulG
MNWAARRYGRQPANERGVTLVELILFIVIVAVVAAAMFQAFSGTMRGSHLGKEMTHATALAQERMEIILGQRKRLGYTSFIAGDYDPCQPPPALAAPWDVHQACLASAYPAGNFIVQSVLSAPDACGLGCSLVSVTVAGPGGAVVGACTGTNVLTCLTSQVWSY